MIQPHLKIDKIQNYVLLPGDPDRVGKILKFLTNEKEINNNRGLRIAEGNYEDTKISVVTTGMGCPSAAIVTEELANVKAKVLIRIGTCGGLLKEMEPGDLIIPDSAWCADGTTKEYGYENQKIKANKEVFNALVEAAKKLKVRYFVGTNRTHDAFYEPLENFTKLEGKNLVSSEMECSAVFLVAQLRKMMAGAILTVNTPEPPEEVRKNPEVIYRLVDENKVDEGMKNSIKVVLEAIKILESKNLKTGYN
ncbi:nucleoside phosphorylase [Candidatus Pacearchaeota archaeon]|nr:nucleoside phosphorylase [Candidatus Pacearchaeota archaeon]